MFLQITLLDHFLTIVALLSLFAMLLPEKKKDGITYNVIAWADMATDILQTGLNFLIPLFRKNTYTSGAYALGEIYRRNVMGENIATRNAAIIGDEAVYIARNIFTAGFGVYIGSNIEMDLLRDNNWPAYRDKMKAENPNYIVTEAQFMRAATLKKMYFPYQNNPPQFLWDLANFDKLPYLGPIPDVEKKGQLMTAQLPGGAYVENGYFVNPTASQAAAITAATTGAGSTAAPTGAPMEQTAGGFDKKSLMIIGAGAVGVYLLSRKKR